MTRPIRVLVVDDSVVVRRAVTAAITADPEFDVVAAAPNGRAAINRLEVTAVDAVVLDVEMPELDGLGTLAELRPRWPKLPVIMCSTLTERGAAVTVEALARGATDYVTKPSGHANFQAAIEALGLDLRAKIRAAVKPAHPPVPVVAPGTPRRMETAPAMVLPRRATATPEVLAVASSTGGPNALLEVLSALPELPVPVVVVQHMPPFFTKLLAERISNAARMPVCEGEDGTPVRPGAVWIAPGGRHMELVRRGDRVELRLHDDPPENSCRPAADVLFRSAAKVYGPAVLGLVLTGMGQDGLEGSRAICAAGGSVLAQDEATSVVWGMPGFVARAGLAEAVLPLPEIAAAVVRGVRAGSMSSSMRSSSGNPRERLPVRP